jgi:tRNA(His) 5'-end guanylyltransferase
MGNNKKDSLGDRMKANYENRSKTFLTRRTPCIIRLDGKAFHSFTSHFQKPYDEVFHKAMNSTLQYLCKNIQGCKFGYTQSDEISLLLTDYDTINTDAWFGYNVQKMCSIAASMATLEFNRKFEYYSFEWWSENHSDPNFDEKYGSVYKAYIRSKDTGAMFDARCFNIPASEVVNCFVWRQEDATRNAIQMLGQTYFNHNELHKKKTDMIQEMLWQKGINFNDMPIEFKRGICCYKRAIEVNGAARTEWYIDKECPIFTQDRNYIERFLPKEN